MVKLTPVARQKILDTMEQLASQAPYVGLRVGVRGGGCSGLEYTMMLVVQEDIDPSWNALDQEGVYIYVDPISAMYLDGVSIDYVIEDEFHQGFKFNNLNVKSTCGCGKSFGV